MVYSAHDMEEEQTKIVIELLDLFFPCNVHRPVLFLFLFLDVDKDSAMYRYLGLGVHVFMKRPRT